jgi:DNA polymerase-4
MNDGLPDDEVQWLFLDLNAYFASCEQQENPALRDKPVIILQTIADNACAIAASYEAKRLGIRTGTLLREARQICRDVVPVKARHALYTQYHHRILEAVDTCLPIEKIMSIDEMACRLMGREKKIPAARALAMKVKDAIREQVGDRMTCSIGLAPNIFLGKVGSDLKKPDGLVVLTKANLPGAMLNMKLQDIYGIGPRMEQRLNRMGIYDVARLWQTPQDEMRRVWGGINGVLFYQMLHGADIQPPESAEAKSMGHQHVLEPELRTHEGAKNFAFHLLTKAAERLRRGDYYCQRLAVNVSWCGDEESFYDEIGFQETWDTNFLLARLENLWARVPKVGAGGRRTLKPLFVGVVLSGLVPADAHQPDLFAQDAGSGRREKLSPLVDEINNRYGRGAIGFGMISSDARARVSGFKGHAAFTRVPEEWEG